MQHLLRRATRDANIADFAAHIGTEPQATTKIHWKRGQSACDRTTCRVARIANFQLLAAQMRATS